MDLLRVWTLCQSLRCAAVWNYQDEAMYFLNEGQKTSQFQLAKLRNRQVQLKMYPTLACWK